MNDNLFDIPETKSPRLIWMDRHGVWTQELNGKWIATASIFDGRGDTENDAIVNLAKKMVIKLWNEL